MDSLNRFASVKEAIQFAGISTLQELEFGCEFKVPLFALDLRTCFCDVDVTMSVI